MDTPKVNVLLVDDRPENLLAMKAVLDCPDYNLVTAVSGEEALKQVLIEEFAIILMDVQMPGLNGFDTARLIRERKKTRHIPIIFVTAIYQATEHIISGYNAGAIDYIFKPINPESLKLKVDGFVRLYRDQQKIRRQSALLQQHSQKLEKANASLKRAAADIQKAEALARIISDTSLDSIFTLNEEGHIMAVNPTVSKMFGYDGEDLLAQHIKEVLPFFTAPKVRELVTVGHLEQSGLFVETTAVRRDGSLFPVDMQVGQARIEESLFFVCAVRDISLRKQLEDERKKQYSRLEELVEERTRELLDINMKLREEIKERKKAEKKLRKSEERFRKIFEFSPTLISIRSVKDGRYIRVNESWINHTGYSYKEVKGKDRCLVCYDPQPEEKKWEAREHLDLIPNVRNVRVSYLTKSGEKRYGLLSTENMEIFGEDSIITVVTDITDRVFLEKEMTRLDRLHLVGEMAAGIAHEIRNPMTSVRGFLQMARLKSLSQENIELMIEELDRANSIITEFLTLAKNKKSDKKLQDLNKIIRTLFPLIQAEALNENKFAVLELGKCPLVELDEKEIRQVILNTALNGLEAMNQQGKLTIKTYTDGADVVLMINDQGTGIKKDVLEKIGTPFLTTKEEGTGLGLAVCYSVASRHNAIIDFETSQEGTTFYLRFKDRILDTKADADM